MSEITLEQAVEVLRKHGFPLRLSAAKDKMKKFKVILEGLLVPAKAGQTEDTIFDESLTLYVLAENDNDAQAFASTFAEEHGYQSVAISSEEEAKTRQQSGDEMYQFHFPEEYIQMDVESLEKDILHVAYRVEHSVVKDLFDPIKQEQRERARMKKIRDERAARSSGF